MGTDDLQEIRHLFDEYLRMYASRDDRLTTYFSDDFTGFTGGGDFLVKDKQEWIAITRQDFAQVKEPLRIELKDLAVQALSDTIAVTTGFFNIHLPIEDHILSRETARLVLIFRKENNGWKISHSSISIPYYLVREGEVYPLKELVERNLVLEEQVAERTLQLSEANEKLAEENEKYQQAEEALIASQEQLRAIFDASEAGIILVSPRGIIDFANKRMADMFGMTIHDLIGTDYSEHLHPSEKLTGDNLMRQLINGEIQSVSLDRHYIRKDNTDFWGHLSGRRLENADGSLQALVGVIADISDNKRYEKELLESKKRFKAVVDTSPLAIYISDGIEQIAEYINPTFIRLFGYTLDEIPTAEHWYPLAYPDEAYRRQVTEEWLRKVKIAIETRTEIEPMECVVTCKDGSLKNILWGFKSIGDQNWAFGIDLTERKRIEAEKISLEQQLLHAQKLESLGVLAGGIAHDFNNILTSIVGNADLALMRVNPQSPAIDNLRKIELSAARAADLAKQMLAYSGKGQFFIETLDMNSLLEEMLHMLEVSISKKIDLRLNLTPNLPVIEADATQMRQTVMNLVINASEAIGEGHGAISISTGSMDIVESDVDDVYHGKSFKEGRYVYLEIADNGCGMDKETLDKVFDPFFTTKFTGRGLGMAAVLGIVRGHKGFIKVHSEPGKGSTFKIILPASEKLIETVDGESYKGKWKGEGKVLLVDDEKTVRDVGTEMLQELGFSVVTANNGYGAVEMFKADPGITFVILDLTMPQMDGEQCFCELKRLKPEVKVIISSGFSEQEVSQKFVGKGLAGFIQKPYKISELKNVVQKI